MTNTTDSILTAAGRIIDTTGWCQRSLGNWDRGFCAIGAVQTAVGGYGGSYAYDPAYRPALDLLADLIGREHCHTMRGQTDAFMVVAGWNDAPHRTKDEVLDLFRQAAAIARGADEADMLALLQQELVQA